MAARDFNHGRACPGRHVALGWWGVPLAVFAGAMRSSTPFLFVSLGELLTEKSGRINLGQEGILVLGAMCGYGIAFLTGSPWLGVLVAETSVYLYYGQALVVAWCAIAGVLMIAETRRA